MLFEDFMQTHHHIEKLTQDRLSTNNDIVNICASTGEKMKKLIEMTSAKPSQLLNHHNALFLTLMESLQEEKKQELKKEKMLKATQQ